MSQSAPSMSFWLTKGPGKATDCEHITRQEECKAGHGACRYLKHLAPPAVHCTVSQSLCVSQKPAAPLRVSSFNAIQQCVYTCQNVAQTESRTHAWLVDIPQSTHPNSQM